VSPKLEKIAFKPLNLALGIGAGALAGLLFKQVWKFAAGDDDAPDAGDEDRGILRVNRTRAPGFRGE